VRSSSSLNPACLKSLENFRKWCLCISELNTNRTGLGLTGQSNRYGDDSTSSILHALVRDNRDLGMTTTLITRQCTVTHCTVLSLLCPGVVLCAQSRMSDAPSLQTGTVLCSGRYHVQKEINSELTDLKLSLIPKLKLLDCLQGEVPPLFITVWTAYKVGQ